LADDFACKFGFVVLLSNVARFVVEEAVRVSHPCHASEEHYCFFAWFLYLVFFFSRYFLFLRELLDGAELLLRVVLQLDAGSVCARNLLVTLGQCDPVVLS